MIILKTRRRKLRAAMWATREHLPIPKGIHPNAPGEGKPTRALYTLIQRHAHLKITGTWTPQLELLLFPDALVPAWRDLICRTARSFVTLREAGRSINYSEGAARLNDMFTIVYPLYMDCSAGVKRCYALSVIDGKRPPDPTGEDWRPEGNTTSMMEHAQHITRAAAKHADYGVFSWGEASSSVHTFLLLEDGNVADPLIWNMGEQGEPVIMHLSEEADHRLRAGQHLTFCRVLHG